MNRSQYAHSPNRVAPKHSAFLRPVAAAADRREQPFSPEADNASAAPAGDATRPHHPICEGRPTMLIWRNLDPKLLARLLIQASAIWKARNAAARTQGDDNADGTRRAGKSRVRRGGTGDA